MDKSQNNNSQHNIRMTKTNYQKALDYYNLQDKSAKSIAAKMKIKIKMTKDKSKKLPTLSEQVETELIKRWKDDSRDVGATFNLTFQKYNKKNKKYTDGVFKFNVRGQKRDIPKLAKAMFERRVESLQEEYEEWKDFDYYQSGDLIEIEEREGSGINNGKSISTTKGGQRKVGIKGNKAVIKMRDRHALKFTDTDDHWDRGVGTCVFDYLYENYRCKEFDGTKRKTKTREEAYEWLNNLFKTDETENPLQEGVSVNQLEKFCDEFNINMYAYDETEGLIEFYKPKKVGNYKPLVFRVFDGHFSPYPDDKRKSVSSRASYNGIIKSNEVETYNPIDKSNKPYEVIAPTQEEYDAIKEKLKKTNYPISVRNQIAINYIKENGMKIPYPLNENNLVVDESSIIKLRYDDKIVLTEPINPRLKKWYEDNGEEYNGEGYINIMNRIWLEKYGFKLAEAPFLSKPNMEVSKALSAPKIKWRTHLGLTEKGQQYTQENIIEMLQTNKAISVDICKCYCDALYNPRERWIVFNGKEQLEEYDNKPLTLGLYFVETNDLTLFHQSNWYSKQIITKAKQEGIKFKITHQIRCVDIAWEHEKFNEDGKSIWKLSNANLFGNIIDEIVELTEQDEDFTLTKTIINSISGYLGKTHYKTRTASVNTKLKDIWENWVIGDKSTVIQNNEEIYINEMTDGDTKIYLYGVEKTINRTTNGLPMYIQILDSANIALYNMIKEVGGECIYRKTDCIVSVGGKLPENKTIKYPCAYQETFGKYRLVDDAENYNYSVKLKDDRAVETPKLADNWLHYDFNDSNDWKFIIEKAIENKGMLIKGRAGTGKSHIIKKGIEAGLLPADKETRMALTNKAARNLDGVTIHKNLAINSKNKTNDKTLKHLTKYNVFIIDEISMIYADLWNKLCLLKQTTKATFILLGDHRQLEPIEDGASVDYFNHSYVKYLTNNNCCELTTAQRYDTELWNWLEDFYEQDIIGEQIIKKKLTINDIYYRKNICYTNKMRKTINQQCMEFHMTSLNYTPIKLEVNKGILAINKYADTVYLYPNLPVMAIKGNEEKEIINGEEFTIINIKANENIITLKNEDYEIDISFNEFQGKFVVNYATTTHKLQGSTISQGINIFEWNKMVDDKKLAYTAVSRGKSCGQIWINEDDIIDDENDFFDPPDDDY